MSKDENLPTGPPLVRAENGAKSQRTGGTLWDNKECEGRKRGKGVQLTLTAACNSADVFGMFLLSEPA